MLGTETVSVEVPEGATVAQLRAALVAQFPNFEACAGHVLFAVNGQYAQDDVVLNQDAEVACIPPVSGG
jgi:molybdopterin converting factor small subunit